MIQREIQRLMYIINFTVLAQHLKKQRSASAPAKFKCKKVHK